MDAEFDDRPPDSHTWKPLRLFALYRLAVATLFFGLLAFGVLPRPLGRYFPALFIGASTAYLLFALLALLAVRQRFPAFGTQVLLQVGIDIVLTTLLMHASGGMASGLGLLLVVSVAAGGILAPGRAAAALAALAALAVLAEQAVLGLAGTVAPSFPIAGALGGALFASAALTHTLARRIRESEALAQQRGVDLANMAELARYVMQQIATGVVAVDHEDHVRLVNTAAWEMLARPDTGGVPTLARLSPPLAEHLDRWRRGGLRSGTPLKLEGGQEVLLTINGVGTGQYTGSVIFLEDGEAAARQARQIKLTALGRLTAGVAHEVRNPLGAISHAGQLLGESPDLPAADRRLVEIILEQSGRINRIVESILQLGRRGNSQPDNFTLLPWLDRFAHEFIKINGLAEGALRVEADPATAIRFDPTHLHQIVTNLCQNALQHTPPGEAPEVMLRAAGSRDQGGSYLEVINRGTPVAPELTASLFEPFATGRPGGTGLGLYLSRELAESNGARLDYRGSDGTHTRFRLIFGRPMGASLEAQSA